MKWISVDNELPQEGITVLAYAKGNSKFNGAYTYFTVTNLIKYHGKIQWSCTLNNNETVTHWMPIPDEPK